MSAAGTIYLLHFDRPISATHTAQHYLGWALDLDQRLADHAAGHGARLPAVAVERGISWILARTWAGTRHVEARLKRQHHGPRLCPICTSSEAHAGHATALVETRSDPGRTGADAATSRQ